MTRRRTAAIVPAVLRRPGRSDNGWRNRARPPLFESLQSMYICTSLCIKLANMQGDMFITDDQILSVSGTPLESGLRSQEGSPRPPLASRGARWQSCDSCPTANAVPKTIATSYNLFACSFVRRRLEESFTASVARTLIGIHHPSSSTGGVNKARRRSETLMRDRPLH